MNMQPSTIVLEEFFILPLNSPEYYAPYNGAIEESQREVKSCLRGELSLASPECRDHLPAYAEAAVNDLNHRVRPVWMEKPPCQVFFAPTHKPVIYKARKEGDL